MNTNQKSYLKKIEKEINETPPEHLKEIWNTLNEGSNLYKRFQDFEQAIIAMAKLDFSNKLEVSNGDTAMDHLASILNMLTDELKYKTINKFYLQSILDSLSAIALLVNIKGEILFANNSAKNKLIPENSDKNIVGENVHKFINIKELRTRQQIEIELSPLNSEKVITIGSIHKVLSQDSGAEGYFIFTEDTHVDDLTVLKAKPKSSELLQEAIYILNVYIYRGIYKLEVDEKVKVSFDLLEDFVQTRNVEKLARVRGYSSKYYVMDTINKAIKVLTQQKAHYFKWEKETLPITYITKNQQKIEVGEARTILE